MTQITDPKGLETDSPQPTGEFERIQLVSYTTSCNSMNGLLSPTFGKIVTVHGTKIESVIISYNLVREKLREANLLANRGPITTPSTSSDK